MTQPPTVLAKIPGHFVILRLPPDSRLPDWLGESSFYSATRTPEELSLVVSTSSLPASHAGDRQKEWMAIRFVGQLDFALTGVIANLSTCLAIAGISVFVVSTYDTDYVLMPSEQFHSACEILVDSGFTFVEAP